jgi:hypothetical protein
LNVAHMKGVMGEPETALSLLHESLELARELGDRRGEAWALWGLGAAHFLGGDVDGASDFSDQSRLLFEEIADDTWGLGNALANQAGIAAVRGDPFEAREKTLRAIDVWETQGNEVIIGSEIRFLAMAANAAGRPERAVKLAAAASVVREKMAGKVPDAFYPFREPHEAAAEMLDPETFDRLWAEGRAMSIEEAVAYAREEW